MVLSNKKKILLGSGAIAALVIVYIVVSFFVGPSTMSIYNKVASDDVLEVRNYQEVMLVQVQLEGDRESTLKQGKALLEGFFNGGNSFNFQIPMHAPIFQQQSDRDEKQWTVSMILPDKYKGNDLPMPNDKQVKINLQPAQNYAVVSFCGFYSDENFNEQYERLSKDLLRSKTVPKSKPVYLYYNPGWTFPWVRHIEVATYVPNNFQLAQ